MKIKKGVILDYDADNQLVGIEILNASDAMEFPSKVEYEVAYNLESRTSCRYAAKEKL